jgi:hypothetical protein
MAPKVGYATLARVAWEACRASVAEAACRQEDATSREVAAEYKKLVELLRRYDREAPPVLLALVKADLAAALALLVDLMPELTALLTNRLLETAVTHNARFSFSFICKNNLAWVTSMSVYQSCVRDGYFGMLDAAYARASHQAEVRDATVVAAYEHGRLDALVRYGDWVPGLGHTMTHAIGAAVDFPDVVGWILDHRMYYEGSSLDSAFAPGVELLVRIVYSKHPIETLETIDAHHRASAFDGIDQAGFDVLCKHMVSGPGNAALLGWFFRRHRVSPPLCMLYIALGTGSPDVVEALLRAGAGPLRRSGLLEAVGAYIKSDEIDGGGRSIDNFAVYRAHWPLPFEISESEFGRATRPVGFSRAEFRMALMDYNVRVVPDPDDLIEF